MENLNKVKEQIEKDQIIHLSSNFTKAGTILAILATVVMIGVIGSQLVNNQAGIPLNVILAALLAVILGIASTLQLMYAAEAKLQGRKLILKKLLGKEYEIDVKQIQKISAFTLKRTKYTIITFTGMHGSTEKALILNSNSLIFGKEISASDVIKLAQGLKLR